MEEAEFGAVAVSVEAASAAVFGACLRHAPAADLSGRAHPVGPGLTPSRDPEACDRARGTVQAGRGRRCARQTLTVSGTPLCGAAWAPNLALRLPGFGPERMEARGNRSAQIARLW